MGTVIGYIVVSILQMSVYTIYIREMLGMKRSIKWLPLCIVIAETINFLNEKYINFELANSIVYFVTLLAIAFFMGRGQIRKKLITTITFVVMSILVEMLIVGLVIMTNMLNIEDIQTSQQISNILLLLVQMFIFVGIQIVVYVLRKRIKSNTTIRHSAWVFCNSLGCFVAMVVVGIKMARTNDFSLEQILVLVILVSVNFISYYFYNVSIESNEIKIESEVYRKQVTLYNEWYESSKNIREETARVRHDMKNHIGALKGIAEGEDEAVDKIKEIVNYIETLDLNNVIEHTTDSGNILIDAILDVKKSYAKSLNIELCSELNIPRNIKFDEPDFVIVFGNLVDNAIEACARNGGKVENKIFVKIKNDRGNMFVFVKNTYDGSLDGNDGRIGENFIIETSKRDKKNHGLGLSNVARTVNKYDGEVKWKAKEGYFIVNVMMYQFIRS